MKELFFILSSVFLMLLLLAAGCDNDKNNDDNAPFPDAVIIKVLPKITAVGNSNSSEIVQTQKGLEAIFSQKDLEPFEDLQDIDFLKHTLLLGYGTYSNEVSYMEHSFTKTETSVYTYILRISGLATRPDVFRYGIVVNKLPASAEIVFEIEELEL
jgi:hypothetical protein